MGVILLFFLPLFFLFFSHSKLFRSSPHVESSSLPTLRQFRP